MKTHFSLEKGGQELTAVLGNIGDVDQTFINGKKIGSSGSFFPNGYWALNKLRCYSIPTEFLNNNEDNELLIHAQWVFGYRGGIFGTPLGIFERETANRICGIHTFFRTDLIWAFGFIIALIGAYHLLLFFHRREQHEYLNFALFSLFVAILEISLSCKLYEHSTSVRTLLTVNILAAIFGTYFLLCFIFSYFAVSAGLIRTISTLITTLATLSIFVAPNIHYIIKIYSVWYLWLFFAISISVFIAIQEAVIRKSRGNLFLVIGVVAFAISVVSDVLVTLNLYEFAFITGPGFMALTVGISASLASDFSNALRTSDEKVKLLTKLNDASAIIGGAVEVPKLVELALEVVKTNAPMARAGIIYKGPTEFAGGDEFPNITGDEKLALSINLDELIETGRTSGTWVGGEPGRLHWSKMTFGAELYGLVFASLPASENKTSDATQFVQTVIPQVATAMARAIAYEYIQSIVKQQRDALVHQEKIAAIGVLAYGIRHEINNPLHSLSSKIGFIESSYRALPDLPELQKFKLFRERKRVEEFFDLINEATSRMRYILNALESFRDNSQTREVVDVHKGIDDALAILKSKLGFNIGVIKEYCEDGTLHTFKSINNVSLNLLSNAIDAIGENPGKIFVKTERTAQRFILQVQDTGCGMSEETMKKMYEPFFTTKGPGKGTGLGLHLVHQIVYDQLKGKIEYQSKVNEGTTARITIPIATTA